MTAIYIENLEKSFGNLRILSHITLNVASGEFVVLVGPSGCGKTTLLRSLAGLEEVQGGKIIFDETDVTHIAAKERGIGMVFQNYALYPHLTVADNLAYPLRILKQPKQERDKKIKQVSQLLEIEKLLHKKPAALSGGQRQRVAIGRALVREPKVFLFDEPLSNLDARLRERTREEIAKLHLRLQRTTVYVTHDQHEAMTLADKLIVMKDGTILQSGTPSALYNDPSCKFVAHFLGTPPCNFVEVTCQTKTSVRTHSGDLAFSPLPEAVQVGEALWLGIRTEDCSLSLTPQESALQGKVILCENLGREWQVQIAMGQDTFRVFSKQIVPVGTDVYITFNQEKIFFFDKKTEKRIY